MTLPLGRGHATKGFSEDKRGKWLEGCVLPPAPTRGGSGAQGSRGGCAQGGAVLVGSTCSESDYLHCEAVTVMVEGP